MTLSPRALAFRLCLWCAVLGWAIWKMRTTSDAAADLAVDPNVRELLAPAGESGAAPTARPADPGAQPLAPVDPEALHRVVVAVPAASRTCSVAGTTLTVRVGPAGLMGATLRGPATDAGASCVASTIQALHWPSGAGEMEEEIGL